MPIPYPINLLNPPIAGDAVNAFWNGALWQVERANAASLAVMPTVLGVWDGTLLGGQANILINGDALPPGIALGPGAPTLVAVDPNAGPLTPNLIRVARPNGSEFIVGTSDQAGGVTVQPRASRDTSPAHVFNANAYGLRVTGPGVTSTANSDVMDRIMDAIDALDPSVGAVIEFDVGEYPLARPIQISRDLTLRGRCHGAAATGASAGTKLLFDQGVMGLIVHRGSTSATGGAGDFARIENLSIWSQYLDLTPRPDLAGIIPRGTRANTVDPDRGPLGIAGGTATGSVQHPIDENRWHFEALTANAALGMDPYVLNAIDPGTGLPGAARPISIDRTILTSTNPAAGLVEITTAGPHHWTLPTEVFIKEHFGNALVPDNRYIATPTGPNTFTIGVPGDGGATGTGGTATDAIVQDGDVWWAVRAHAGITLRARAMVRNCWIQSFTNAGVHIAAPYGADGPGVEIGSNASRFHLEDVVAADCGTGFAVHGPETNAGVGISCDALAPGRNIYVPASLPPEGTPPLTYQGRSKGGHGIHDESFLGNTWMGSHVAGSDDNVVTGFSYHRTHTAGGITLVGDYGEDDMPWGRFVAATSVSLGGTGVIARASSGMILNAGAVRNVRFQTLDDLRVDPTDLDPFGPLRKPRISYDPLRVIYGSLELPNPAHPHDIPLPNSSGGGVYSFSHTDEDEDGGVVVPRETYLFTKYNDGGGTGGGMDPSGIGEWSKTYGSVTGEKREYIRYLARKSTRGGKPNWCDPHGHFIGFDAAEHYFAGPLSGRYDKWIRAGGRPATDPNPDPQFHVGDRFEGTGTGRIGSLTGKIVTKAGWNAITAWGAGEYPRTAVPGMAADLISTYFPLLDEVRIFKCTGVTGDGQTGAAPPDWEGTAPTPGMTVTETTATGSVTWTHMGGLCEYGEVGKIYPSESFVTYVTNHDTANFVAATWLLADNTAVEFAVTAWARATDASEAVLFKVTGAWFRYGGAVATPVVAPTVTATGTPGFSVAVHFSLSVDGKSAILVVTGDAGKRHEWTIVREGAVG